MKLLSVTTLFALLSSALFLFSFYLVALMNLVTVEGKHKLSPLQQQAAETTPRNSFSTYYAPTDLLDEITFDQLLLEEHVINARSGCDMTSWVYPSADPRRPGHNDCEANEARDVRSPLQLQAYDTLFVPMNQMLHFVDFFLPNITTPIVVVSGQWHDLSPEKYMPELCFFKMVDSPHIVRWFLQNKPTWAWPEPKHPKISSFPFGVKPKRRAYLNQLQLYRADPLVKTDKIFVSYLSNSTSSRARIQSGVKRLDYTEYIRAIRAANYTLSPNGDRPDCYRHYEAIGMGSMPITELNDDEYEHFGHNVIYATKDWDLATLQRTLPERMNVNRKLVFEEYWMEYMERTVGHPLRVWDRRIQVRVLVSAIAERIRLENNQQHTYHKVKG
jgi:hypothetical protein